MAATTAVAPGIKAAEDPAQELGEPATTAVVVFTHIATPTITIVVVAVAIGAALVVAPITVVVAPVPVPMRRDFTALVTALLRAGVHDRHRNEG